MSKDLGNMGGQQWNMANFYMIRMHQQLTLCNLHSMHMNTSEWFQALGPLYREVSSNLNDKELEEVEKEWDELFKMNDNFAVMLSTSRGKINSNRTFIRKLHKFDIKMRYFIDKYKLLTPKPMSAMDALDVQG